MQTFLVIVLIGLTIMVVVSLVRGIVAFLKSTKVDLETGAGDNVPEMQLKQNKMMFNRILFQGAAIVVVVLIMLGSR